MSQPFTGIILGVTYSEFKEANIDYAKIRDTFFGWKEDRKKIYEEVKLQGILTSGNESDFLGFAIVYAGDYCIRDKEKVEIVDSLNEYSGLDTVEMTKAVETDFAKIYSRALSDWSILNKWIEEKGGNPLKPSIMFVEDFD